MLYTCTNNSKSYNIYNDQQKREKRNYKATVSEQTQEQGKQSFFMMFIINHYIVAQNEEVRKNNFSSWYFNSIFWNV